MQQGRFARLKAALDAKMQRREHRAINQTFYRLRLIVLIALTTGMRMAEIFALKWAMSCTERS